MAYKASKCYQCQVFCLGRFHDSGAAGPAPVTRTIRSAKFHADFVARSSGRASSAAARMRDDAAIAKDDPVRRPAGNRVAEVGRADLAIRLGSQSSTSYNLDYVGHLDSPRRRWRTVRPVARWYRPSPDGALARAGRPELASMCTATYEPT